MRALVGFLFACGLALGIFSPALADDAARARLAGRTLDVVVAFSNTGGGARFWGLFSEALRRQLPETIIRARFDDAGSGSSAANDLFAMPPGSLAVGFARPAELGFAQAQGREDVHYDISKAIWLNAVERESHFIAARKGIAMNLDELRKQRPIVPVHEITDTQSIIVAMLNAVTGIPGRLVVGFGNSDRLKAIVSGDGDFYTLSMDPEVWSLLESGDIVSLYTLSGDQFPPTVDQTRTLATAALPGVPEEVLQYILVARTLGRAFFAPPGVAPEDAAALRSAFDGAMQDPDFLAAAKAQSVPVALVPGKEVHDDMEILMLSDPKMKAEVEKVYACGMAMSEGTADHCDFGQ